ncbi:HEAT repeat domain-containing protein [Halogeometricum luteum]|uniref:HEAT repeat domain-containing protein n=1 Tax=Halogeometricum luteum TaxID=2950537 RepID=A0ABU2FYZ2_9EURY|nr:HEAT repeat domain-containing protein [Halogeometricum sp. S3BR5-2]MDS0293735.1 HEAT repeat domain-containing protein [Halogeometricum sp. S3BR5-2]
MEEPNQSALVERIPELIRNDARETATRGLDALREENAETRKLTLQTLRHLADDDPTAFSSLCASVAPFLTDDERPIRLTTAKLLVAVAEADPDAVVPVVPALADRLADEDEFYYVRARSAEALGYVALERPEEVNSPEVLADLRVGLSFDEPEVKEKLAKALEFVALGDPRRLRRQVSHLVEHADDENELVRYHLCTAAAVVGCEYPAALVDARAELRARLDDDSPFVRGRAAEALGVSVRDDTEGTPLPDAELADDEESFAAERARFALQAANSPSDSVEIAGDIGTVEGIRRTTDDAATEILSPETDGECSHCGLTLPENGPPMCPRCGVPY